MLRKITYVCKNCGWEKKLPEQWSDLRPKRCGNPKCNTSFVLHKDKLEIKFPKKLEKVKKLKQEEKSDAQPQKSESKQEESDYKFKKRSKYKQQQDKKEDSE
jgi:hypothetical protein